MLKILLTEGNKIGMRGHIAAENYKLLLLVNGKNITNFVYEGVITEIDQWDLNDIQRIEVVSGPGSVTYGSGAIGGVINIITKSAKDAPAFGVRLNNNDTYNSHGVNLQYSISKDKFDVYGFLSLTETDGYKNPNYYGMDPGESTDIRFIGKKPDSTSSPQDFLANSLGRSQIKAHFSVDYDEDSSIWMRYTQSGQTRFFTQTGFTLDEDGNPDEEVNRSQSQTRHLIFSADHAFDFEDETKLDLSLTFDTQEYIRYRLNNPQYSQSGVNNIKDYAFSQERVKLSALYEFNIDESIEIITGYEFGQIQIGAPWGKNRDHIWIREGSHLISDFSDSVYTQDLSLSGRPNPSDYVEVGSGIGFDIHSHLIESKMNISDTDKLIYAHRLDLPSGSDYMFSPRVSLISHLNHENTLVSSIQRAQRMMPLRAQYLSNLEDGGSKYETLDGLEVSFANTDLENTFINLRGYYNKIDAVGYTGSELQLLAEYDLYGLEFLLKYKFSNVEFTVNHAYLEPLDVVFNPDLKDGLSRNNISFADYYYYTRSGIPILLEGYGSGLNNWSTNITKFIYTHTFLNNRYALHMTAQIFWDYDGSYDEMRMYQQAYESFDRTALTPAEEVQFEEQYQQFLRERSLLEETGAFETDYNLNASITYTLPADANGLTASFKLYAENIIESSYRYNVSTGSNKIVPDRLQYFEKPLMVGFSVDLKY